MDLRGLGALLSGAGHLRRKETIHVRSFTSGISVFRFIRFSVRVHVRVRVRVHVRVRVRVHVRAHV